ILKENAFAGKQVARAKSEKPSNARHFGHAHRHAARHRHLASVPQASQRSMSAWGPRCGNAPEQLKPHNQSKRSMTPAISDAPSFIEVGEGPSARKIAVRRRAGQGPGLLWLGGFKSDMQGTKAVALNDWAKDRGRASVRFDYSGHGESSGDFA